ncbi:MAG: hypothetical protein FWE85_00105 [Clostridiales bacterium]|nr:hypothetical protein [Clostridiales bacterium]
MRRLSDLSGDEIVLLAVTTGLLLAQNMDAAEQDAAGNFFILMAQVLRTEALQTVIRKTEKMAQDIEYLKNMIGGGQIPEE